MSKTFSLEEQLPNLLVPSLENTIDKYLYSIQAVASNEHFKKTSNICKSFIGNEGLQLQKILKEREKSHRNWIETLWVDHGYLEVRTPLAISNFYGTSSYFEQFWPFQNGTQIERASLDLHFLYKYWNMIREEKVDIQFNSNKDPFSMHQLRSLFNSCRVPKEKKDVVVKHFKTVSEGNTPAHVIVLNKGHLFKINLCNPNTGHPYSPTEFENVLQKIVEHASGLEESPGVATLTALDRDTWADTRNHLLGLSSLNHQIMDKIESSICVLSLDEEYPENFTNLLDISVNGDPKQRWRDKSYNVVWTANGGFSAVCEHTMCDGIPFVNYIHFVTMLLLSCKGKWTGETKSSGENLEFEELIFDLDDVIKKRIIEGKKAAQKLSKDVSVLCNIYNQVGKAEVKDHQIYPDAFVQICLQLAYMRMHGKPAPTYETATTRQFYHGRTETCRTCIPELVQFCQAFINKKPTKECRILLRSAHDRLLWLMRECQNNRGCDRHLFGLSLAAAEQGGPKPELFTDPMYTESGGNANFVLSTSFVGFFDIIGCTFPMIKDGYGVFYRINDHRIVVAITTWNYSKVTNAEQLWNQLDKSFTDVYDLFRITPASL